MKRLVGGIDKNFWPEYTPLNYGTLKLFGPFRKFIERINRVKFAQLMVLVCSNND